MSKTVASAPPFYCAVLVLALIITPPIFSQGQRTPSRSGSTSGVQSQGDVFNSNSGRGRPCNSNDCPCQATQALAFHEKDCAEHLADFDRKIKKREEEIREINAYPQMRKSKINPAKDPNILLYRHHKAEYQKYCECIKKYYKDMCSLSPEDSFKRSQECVEWSTHIQPYPSGQDEYHGSSERDKRPPSGGGERRGSGRDRRTAPQRDPLGFPPAYADSLLAPLIFYKPKCDRSLLFVNNPEQLKPEDLADNNLGQKTIFETKTTSPSRIFFEHTNRTGYPIGYGIQLINTNKKAVEVIVAGRGFTADSRGGQPFRQLFEQKKAPPQVITVGPGRSMWLIQSKPLQIRDRSFLSGVVDFEVRGGPVLISALGYRNINRVDGGATYEGYITRKDYDPVTKHTTDESRVYKGTIACAELVAEGVDFTIDDSIKAGPLDIQFTPREGAPLINNQWHTHSIRNKDAIKGDMFDIRMPEGIVIRADGLDRNGKVPNLGNWGVVYTLKGHVTNNGNQDRCISIKLQLTDPTETAAIAWRDPGGSWHETRIQARGTLQYYTFAVRAGQQRIPFEASFVLGGPSTTNLLHSVSVLDGVPSCQGPR